jgi:polyphenol oxidase
VSGVHVLRAAGLDDIPHGFLGRSGGVSEGEMWGLNVGYGSGDDPNAIAENRRRAIEAVRPGAELVTVHQIHSATAVHADSAWPHDERPHADALVTDRPGLLLGVLTADCTPVLLADAEAGIIGAAHAGWRGAVAGVTDATIAAMEQLGATREHIHAAVGPSLGPSSFEVGEDLRDQFIAEDEANARFFTAEPGRKAHFDLPSYVRHRLLAAGVAEVETLQVDTYADPDHFYSYRRSTHLGEPSYGRQISLIGLPASG